MKDVKTLGLAIAAAVALTAVLGAGSASATVLCQEYKNPCPKIYPAGTTVSASQEAGTSLVLTAGETAVATCTGSSWSGKVTNAGGAGVPVVGSIESLTFAGCTGTVAIITKGKFVIHHVPPNTEGTLTFQETKLTVEVMGEDCVYGAGAGTHVGPMNSGKLVPLPTIEAEAVLVIEEGPISCPLTLTWESSSKITAPNPTFFKAA